jgi:cephalosporin hydroxylase
VITINMNKAKAIAHDIRRAARAEEFKPYDEVIMKQIPGIDVQAAESARQAIREKYAAMQIAIDSANSPEEIKAVLNV